MKKEFLGGSSTDKLTLSYEQGKRYIEEGDILLFRANSLVGRIILFATFGIHSHVGMASWHNDDVEVVEFREFKGGRTVALSSCKNQRIDVFRPLSQYKEQYTVWEGDTLKIKEVEHTYDGYAATKIMRNMTGMPYGYKRIWLMAKRRIPFLRLFQPNLIKDDEHSKSKDLYPVCSTAVAEAISSVYVDPIPFKPNCYTEPADLARSCLFQYLFTIYEPTK